MQEKKVNFTIIPILRLKIGVLCQFLSNVFFRKREKRSITTQSMSSMQKADRFTALDGLRGLAIISVVIHHGCNLPRNEPWKVAWNSVVSMGSLGGTLFMMLSGFFITKSLLKRSGTSSRMRLITNHYVNRFFRIYPLYLIVFLFVSCVMPVVFERFTGRPDTMYRTTPLNFLLYLFLGTNVKVALFDFSYPFDVTWTISVLEQYYVFWIPLCLTMSVTWLKRITFAVVLISTVSRFVAAAYDVPYHVTHVVPLFRMDAIAIGCFLALLHHEKRLPRPIGGLSYALVVAVVFLEVCQGVFANEHFTWRARYQYLMTNTVSVLAILIAMGCTNSRFANNVLTNPAAIHIGRRSYLIYLVHMPCHIFTFVVLKSAFGKPDASTALAEWLGVVAGVLNIGISLVGAEILHRAVEAPLNRWRERRTTNPSA